jgi:glycosyltransferase involved in cell wall biosynthesis
LEHSLGALLPVRNVEATLERAVSEMLEILPELTGRFEFVIVDDCSCDATIEVADELAKDYPQLTVLRHGRPQGRVAAIETALRHARGEVIFLADADCDLSLGEVRRLWSQLAEHELVLGRPTMARRRGGPRSRPTEPGSLRGYQLGYRRVFLALARAMHDQVTLVDYLQRHGLQWHEVEIEDRAPRVGPHRIAATARGLSLPGGESTDRSQRADVSPAGPSRPKRPKYLARLRDFAFGE